MDYVKIFGELSIKYHEILFCLKHNLCRSYTWCLSLLNLEFLIDFIFLFSLKIFCDIMRFLVLLKHTLNIEDCLVTCHATTNVWSNAIGFQWSRMMFNWFFFFFLIGCLIGCWSSNLSIESVIYHYKKMYF